MKIVFVLLMGCLLTGCVSMQPLEKDLSDDQIYQKIFPGDELIIDLKGQEKIKIVVTEVTRDHIDADGQIYPFKDIREIRKKGISIWRTAGAAVGVYFLAGTIAFISLLGSLQ